MKHLHFFAIGAVALVTAACGGAEESAPAEKPEAAPAPEMADETHDATAMDHSGHDMSAAGTAMGGDVGHGVGVIRSIGDDGYSLAIDHGPIEGIGMGAMTMGFEIMGDIDLSGFAEGDNVAFMVKRGRDNSYRITAMCNTETNGADCLDASE